MLAKSALQRIVSATRWVEGYADNRNGVNGSTKVASHIGWWGVAKDRINHGADGEVWVVEGSGIAPTASTTNHYKVSNPRMGDIIPDMPVFVIPASINTITTDHDWFIAPFEMMYEAKAKTNIGSGGSGTFQIWHDASRSPAVEIEAHVRWVPGSQGVSGGAQVRLKWDMFKQRMYVDAMDCG